MAVLDEWSPPRFAGEQKPAYRPPDSKITSLEPSELSGIAPTLTVRRSFLLRPVHLSYLCQARGPHAAPTLSLCVPAASSAR